MNDAVKYFQKNGLQRSRELVEMGFGFCSLEDGLSLHTEQLKQIVESHELVERLGGFERAKKAITLSDKKLGYTHVYLHSNKFYCFLDDSVDYIIPDKAIDIRLALKAIADVESCMGVSSESN